MGGGPAMRAAAAKLAGIGVGLRGIPVISPAAEHPAFTASRKAKRPAPAIVSNEANWIVSDRSNFPIEAAAAQQRPCWELDDWEFAAIEEEVVEEKEKAMVKSGDSMARLVFGGAPTLEEATEATSQLKEALDKVYLCSPNSVECGDQNVAGDESGLLLHSKDAKACVTGDDSTMLVPKGAIKAFRILNENAVVQSVVASIACDPNVWDAVQQNKALMEFMLSHGKNINPAVEESAADAKSPDQQSPKSVDDSSDSAQFAYYGNGLMDYLESIRTRVVAMMSSLSDYFQDLFGGPTTEKDLGVPRTTFLDGAMAASFMGLAVMVIMLVVLKRG